MWSRLNSCPKHVSVEAVKSRVVSAKWELASFPFASRFVILENKVPIWHALTAAPASPTAPIDGQLLQIECSNVMTRESNAGGGSAEILVL